LSQSGYIAALLLAAFILFLAAQDRLREYLAVLWGATAKPQPGTTGAPFAAPGAAPGPGAPAAPGLGFDIPGLSGGGGGIGGLLKAAPEILLLAGA
jgi:hypothetical protein